MTIDRDSLPLFFSISSLWTERDAGLLAAIGFEYEVAVHAFDQVWEFCLAETDFQKEKWAAKGADFPHIAIMVRAFVDHATRSQKLLRSLADDEHFTQLCDGFFQTHRSLFDLRNAIHHADERIVSGRGAELKHQLCGDFSWKSWTPPETVDLYLMSFGPLLSSAASPSIGGDVPAGPAGDLIYRAHGEETNLGTAYLGLQTLMAACHAELERRVKGQLDAAGLGLGGPEDVRSPAHISGRLRVFGYSAST